MIRVDMDISEAIRARLRAAPAEPDARVEHFLRAHLGGGATDEELLEALRLRVQTHAEAVELDLEALDFLTGERQAPGQLLRLVTFAANTRLVEPSEEAARQWLAGIADVVRRALVE